MLLALSISKTKEINPSPIRKSNRAMIIIHDPRAAIKSVAIDLGIDLEMARLGKIEEIATVITVNAGVLRKREMEEFAMMTEPLRHEEIVRNEKAEPALDLPSAREAREEAANGEKENIHDTNETDTITTKICATRRDAPGMIVTTTTTIGAPEDLHRRCSGEEVTLVATRISEDHHSITATITIHEEVTVTAVLTEVLGETVVEVVTFVALRVDIQALDTVEGPWTIILPAVIIHLPAIAIAIVIMTEDHEETEIDVKSQIVAKNCKHEIVDSPFEGMNNKFRLLFFTVTVLVNLFLCIGGTYLRITLMG